MTVTRVTVIVQTTGNDLQQTIEEIKMQLSDLDAALDTLDAAIGEEALQADGLADIKDGLPQRIERLTALVNKVKGIVPDGEPTTPEPPTEPEPTE